MKTSNKILLFIGIGLFVLPLLNAYNLKRLLTNKQYKVVSVTRKPTKSQLKVVPVSTFDQIHIEGGNDLLVEIIQSDSLSMQIGENTEVDIKQDNGTLNIAYLKEGMSRSTPGNYVLIKTPSIKVISSSGTIVVERSEGANNQKGYSSYQSIRYYKPFEIKIQGFNEDHLIIHNLNGGGSYKLKDNTIENVSLTMGEMTNTVIDSTNTFNLLFVKTTDNAKVTLNNAHIGDLKSNLNPQSELIIKGGNAEN